MALYSDHERRLFAALAEISENQKAKILFSEDFLYGFKIVFDNGVEIQIGVEEDWDVPNISYNISPYPFPPEEPRPRVHLRDLLPTTITKHWTFLKETPPPNTSDTP